MGSQYSTEGADREARGRLPGVPGVPQRDIRGDCPGAEAVGSPSPGDDRAGGGADEAAHLGRQDPHLPRTTVL